MKVLFIAPLAFTILYTVWAVISIIRLVQDYVAFNKPFSINILLALKCTLLIIGFCMPTGLLITALGILVINVAYYCYFKLKLVHQYNNKVDAANNRNAIKTFLASI